MVISSEFREHKPPGGSFHGRQFHKEAFAFNIYPKDHERRTQRREQRQLTHGGDATYASQLQFSVASEQVKPSRLRSNAERARYEIDTAPPSAADAALSRAVSDPGLLGAAAMDYAAIGKEFAAAANWRPPSEPSTPHSQLGGEPSFPVNTRWCPHPCLLRGNLKLCNPRALDWGINPDLPIRRCPFYDGDPHRFGAVAKHPEARPRTPPKSLRWRTEEAWSNPASHASLKVTHMVARMPRDI
eukprot:TRINITY_DN76888_c0_g1_i1.p1 TRINITY_DN76888_c0_g1~~TRINITY_DN76888_c0_g1_i1.p1  ORF type:complete len:243 (+),score=32.86 TRINITY_DN76888_c0_g1_i1:102-830(+)